MKYYSNEIVFRGHPDKVCDQISDALLDAFLKEDENSRCGIEVCGGKKKIFVTGEVTSKALVDTTKIVKRVLRDVGYSDDVEVIDNLGIQSPDIAMGTNDDVGGAGDNGMMFGFATRDTKELLPTAMVILQKFSKAYDDLRQKDERFLSDGKAEITGIYDENEKLVKIKYFTICYQNTEEERNKTDEIIKSLAIKICAEYGIKIDTFLINPTGRFKIGGFDGDAGLTGRKIVVDSYESFAPVGGGAFSGKDLTKVDRSGAYKAREIAKEILLQNNKYKWVQVQLSYAIGMSKPLGIYIKTNLGNIVVLEKYYEECKVTNIVNHFKNMHLKYENTAKYGHFQN